MPDNITPEEKLLRLIRSQGKSVPVKAAQVASLSAAQEKIPHKPQARRLFSSLLPKIGFKNALIFFFIASALYLAAVFALPLFYAKSTRLPEVVMEKNVPAPQSEAKRNNQPLDYYLNATRGRQIFVIQPEPQPDNTAPGAIAADLIKDISLVGVITGVNPQAIVEDKKNQKTYYLTKGQSIGELKLEDIQEGKIIVTHKGQKYELYL
jgi:hypothetical protein